MVKINNLNKKVDLGNGLKVYIAPGESIEMMMDGEDIYPSNISYLKSIGDSLTPSNIEEILESMRKLDLSNLRNYSFVSKYENIFDRSAILKYSAADVLERAMSFEDFEEFEENKWQLIRKAY